MARSMLSSIPERAKNLILGEVMCGSSIFVLADTTAVTRPTYKEFRVPG